MMSFAQFLGKPEEGRTFYHGHTYTGNPLGAAVALASLDLLVGNDLHPGGVLAGLPEKIHRLRTHLERMATLPHVGDVRQQGMMAGIELVNDRRTKQPFPPEMRMGNRVCQMARARGVWLRPLGDVIVVMPPLAIDEPLLDRLCAALYECIRDVTENDKVSKQIQASCENIANCTVSATDADQAHPSQVAQDDRQKESMQSGGCGCA